MRTYLVGMPGCGKSTMAKKWADERDCAFLDLDELIETQQGISIDSIFKNFSENQFRIFEQEALHSTAALAHTIIATGGGTPCFFNNMEWMKKSGHTIYLEVPINVLLNRLNLDGKNRPLLHSDLEQIQLQELLENRNIFYQQAHETVKEFVL